MADDPTDGPEDAAIRDRRQAEGAAGDLARMGIDPRSLGLGVPPAPRREAPPADDDQGPRAPVVYLRPDLAEPVGPAPTVEEVPDSVRPVTDVERSWHVEPAGQPPRQAARLVRTVARGLVTPDAAVTVQDERRLVESVRQRQTDRRVVAVVAGKGGVGTTTVAVAVGTTFMALREDRSVVVDVQQGTPSLGRSLGVERPRSVTALVAEPEATDAAVAPSGLGVVDGSGWDRSLTRSDVAGALERLRDDHAFALLDVGDDAGEAGHAALARADQAVVVTGPGPLGLAALGSVLDRLRAANPQAAATAVHVVVRPHEQAGPAPAGAVVVPPDPWLQQGHAYDPAHVSAATREAFLRVAAAVATKGARG